MSFEIRLEHRVGECAIALDVVSEARVLALVGPSGVGKSSVLQCLAGLARPASGRVAIGGRLLFCEASGVDLAPDKRRAGVVFQDMRLFPHLKVAANLAYGAKLAGGRPAPIAQGEVLDLLDIGALMGRWPATLSGGEARRVAIARALLSAPDFLLLDEPSSSLDAARADVLASLIERLAMPILLVSHDEAEVARLAGEVVRMG